MRFFFCITTLLFARGNKYWWEMAGGLVRTVRGWIGKVQKSFLAQSVDSSVRVHFSLFLYFSPPAEKKIRVAINLHHSLPLLFAGRALLQTISAGPDCFFGHGSHGFTGRPAIFFVTLQCKRVEFFISGAYVIPSMNCWAWEINFSEIQGAKLLSLFCKWL